MLHNLSCFGLHIHSLKPDMYRSQLFPTLLRYKLYRQYRDLMSVVSYPGSSPDFQFVKHISATGRNKLGDLWKLRGNAIVAGLGKTAGFTCLDISVFGSEPCFEHRQQVVNFGRPEKYV